MTKTGLKRSLFDDRNDVLRMAIGFRILVAAGWAFNPPLGFRCAAGVARVYLKGFGKARNSRNVVFYYVFFGRLGCMTERMVPVEAWSTFKDPTQGLHILGYAVGQRLFT